TVATSARYVWLRRRDKSEQAVSWWIAGRTGLWMQKLAHDSRALDDLGYDFDAIDKLRRDTVADESEWQAFFDANSIDPVTIYYEDIVADPIERLGSLSVRLGGSFAPVVNAPDLRNHIQSNVVTRAVHDRYVRELAARVA
ncbi:MAG: Stf0 family sulfotransferase, partial [bacterium]|nr:Stf0 family sulfotransferase [bacterium]